MRSIVLLLVVLTACSPAAPQLTPEASPDAVKRVVARNGVVSAANGLASAAGVEVLRAGGNAVDAAVATAFAIGVVEPQMSGIGGSGAMLIWRQGESRPYYLDFYAAQNVASFAGHTGDVSGADLRVAGIPGLVAGLLEAHGRFGRLPLAQVMAPAIRIAEEGFPVGQILAQFIRSDSAKLHRFPASVAQLWPGGEPLAAGSVFRNPELAGVLREIAQRGRAGFDGGAGGRALVAMLNAHGHPASLSDLAGYAPQWKEPLCAAFGGRIVLSAPPPQTGAQVIETLRLIAAHPVASYGVPTQSARAFDVMVSALRVAMADNRGLNDDPRWRPVAAQARASAAFTQLRAAQVGTGAAPADIATVDAADFEAQARLDPQCMPFAGRSAALPARATGAAASVAHGNEGSGAETTHISVVDEEGSAVALSQTNSTTFGSGAWAGGFFINDSGIRVTDEMIAQAPVAWRTRTSTIAPTIVLEDGRVRLVTGAPGAGRIPTEIAQTIVYMLDYGMDPLEALRMPRIYPSPAQRQVQLEHGFTPQLLAEVRALGYVPVPQGSSYARIYAVLRRDGAWIGVADPRHDGQPRGY